MRRIALLALFTVGCAGGPAPPPPPSPPPPPRLAPAPYETDPPLGPVPRRLRREPHRADACCHPAADCDRAARGGPARHGGADSESAPERSPLRPELLPHVHLKPPGPLESSPTGVSADGGRRGESRLGVPPRPDRPRPNQH